MRQLRKKQKTGEKDPAREKESGEERRKDRLEIEGKTIMKEACMCLLWTLA